MSYPETIGGIPAAEHVRLHTRLRKKHGSASKCENPECKRPDAKWFEWALKKGHKYSDDPKDYLQLCVSCHRKYDVTDEFRENCRRVNMGRVNRGMKAVVCSNGKTYKSICHAAKATGISRNAIHEDLKGKRPNKRGLRWKYKN